MDGILDIAGWKLSFSDDFEGGELDGTKWIYRMGADTPYAGCVWSKYNTFLRDGNLIIRTEQREDGKFYSSAVSGLGKYETLYGYFEARAILPEAEGMSAAFWLLPSAGFAGNTEGGRAGAEIDIMESSVYFSDPARKNAVSMNIHVDGYGPELKSQRVADPLANEPYTRYNTYGLLWTPEGYGFYLNRALVAKSRFHSGPSTVPEYMLLTVAVNGEKGEPAPGWTGDIRKNPASAFPADFVVDYVKVWDLPEEMKKRE